MILRVVLESHHSAKLRKNRFPHDTAVGTAQHGHNPIARLELRSIILVTTISRREDIRCFCFDSNINHLRILVALWIPHDPIGNSGGGIRKNHEPIVHAGITAHVLGIRMELICVVGHATHGIVNVGIPNGRGRAVLEHGGKISGEMSRYRQEVSLDGDSGGLVETIPLPREELQGDARRGIDLGDAHLVLTPRTPRILRGALISSITLHIDTHRLGLGTTWIIKTVRTLH
mmetsp:Transcript_35886/g.64643  ORF Transcript_35886/g.64643 Transcript_35886/m.64643 type:complete len:231 (-) Transcript_35886:365-1057(-)